MNRHAAGKAAMRCDYLTAADKVVFLALLHGANNDDRVLPPSQTPTMTEMVTYTSLGLSSVKRSVRHLQQHGWLLHEAGRGRGHRSSYQLVPGEPDSECHCEKGSQRTPLMVAKGPTVDPITNGKGSTVAQKRVHTDPKKGPLILESPQVNPDFDTRDSRDTGGKGYAQRFETLAAEVRQTFSCDKCDSLDTQLVGPYRLCREHAGTAWKAPA